MNSFGRGFWLHLPCLNARLHHKHAIADLKFDPNNMPDLESFRLALPGGSGAAIGRQAWWIAFTTW